MVGFGRERKRKRQDPSITTKRNWQDTRTPRITESIPETYPNLTKQQIKQAGNTRKEDIVNNNNGKLQ